MQVSCPVVISCLHAAGDTVNTASRMESTGFPMCIQASAAVVEDANMPDSFVSLGERSIKGKGIMTTHLFKVKPALHKSPARE